ncbi:hypothetical protein Ddc_20710 [Ditylenchus destructor]|nr:hypothetical protein Ddc_20710 [Ditylenchus destructor]
MLIYNFYLVIFWRPPGTQYAYTPMGLYWMGLTNTNYVILAPLFVLQLTLDRSLTLAFGHRYSIFYQRFLMGLVAVVICITFIGTTFVSVLELPLDLEKVNRCPNFPCLLLKYRTQPQVVAKNVFTTLNLIGCLSFFYVHKRSSNKSWTAKVLKDRVVKCTVIFGLCFEIIPGYIFIAFGLLTGENMTNYVGQYGILLCCMDAAVCSIFYSRILLQRRHCSFTKAITISNSRTRPFTKGTVAFSQSDE